MGRACRAQAFCIGQRYSSGTYGGHVLYKNEIRHKLCASLRVGDLPVRGIHWAFE